MMPRLTILLCVFVMLPFVIYSATVPTWYQVQNAFGVYTPPFRYGQASACTPDGQLATFSGITDAGAASKDVDRFNYLSDGTIETLETLSSLDNNPRVLSAYGLWKQTHLVTYGGYVGSGLAATPLLLIYDIANQQWVNSTVSFLPDTTPNADNTQNHYVFNAYGASAAIDDTTDNLYLFGGNAISYQLNFVTRVYLPTQQFVQVTLSANSTQSPNRKYGAVMAYTSNPSPTLWIFGGKAGLGPEGTTQQSPKIYNEMSKFDVTNSKWVTVPNTALANRPSPRAWSASVVLADKNTWLVFGGRYDINLTIANQIVYNDLYAFDLGAATWKTFTTAGSPPSARDKAAGMLLNWIGEDSIMIYGGATREQSPLNDFWYLQITSTQSPPIQVQNNTQGGGNTALPSITPSPGISPSTSPVPPDVVLSSAVSLISWLACLL